MAFVKVAAISQLPPGSVMQTDVGGNSYAICNVDGELHALEGFCPHAGGPLGEGALHGYTLVCPWHAWEFDCRTGANDFDPDVVVPSFPVKVQDGDILLDLS
ncbi:MAG TPA: Rieske 2Fe-2S domain-containing protein [Bryobacteraceae bacterium]|jgi:nitrite reductase/ring-hydroxylating ferredoxin subunit